jgi:S-DNA-T family DNA segregation ATPase FtsK/SpoIIIE
VPVELALLTVRMFQRRERAFGLAEASAITVVVFVGCALVHLALGEGTVFGGHLPGGLLGEVLGEVLRSLLGFTGSFVVGTAVLLITGILRTSFSLVQVFRAVVEAFVGGWRRVVDGATALAEAWREASEIERAEREAERERLAPRIADEEEGEPVVFADDTLDEPLEVEDSELEEVAEAEVLEEEAVEEALVDVAAPEPVSEPAPRGSGRGRGKGKGTESGPTIVAPRERRVTSSALPEPEIDEAYAAPPTRLLDPPPPQAIELDEAVLRANAERLTEKLAAYGVRGRVDEIHPGPVVTMYEFEPESGTKISKIAGLSDDLALALAAQKVRIVAPIPGKARVGFELPNQTRQTVFLREILEDPRWPRLKGALPVAFGKDITGQPVYGDLSRMPHLLVAGATGSGKSVGLNVMLASLLQRRSPEEVRLLMIDPKVVELAVFDGIPHMLLPVVTDMKKAALALRWAVDEMERRYQLFADAGARSIASFNQKVDRVQRGEAGPESLLGRRKAAEENPTPVEAEKLPYVVVVVDEFADLMMVAAKDVEAAIARLAQKARAAGIHVLLATQRPSVDVITGMIKANFPARVAFKVSQREDSKVILGRSGAEHLLGMGDLLMIPPGSGDLHRVHSAFISEDEVKRLCDHLREQGRPVYDESILEPRDDAGGFGGAASDDPQYDRAVACVAQAGYCSISHIQRQLKVGYNKAAKLVDRMEAEGVVGPPSGKAGGRREVLVQSL